MTLLSALGLACLAGLYAARRGADDLSVASLARLCGVGAVGIIGAMVAAAELSGPAAHYLSLFAVAFGAAAVAGGLAVAASLSDGGDGRP